MERHFRDRVEAGERLAGKLLQFADRPNLLVLGLPRGGVPVAAEVAGKLRVPLDAFVVRKLGLPGYEELAMGAIASGGVRILNGEVVDSLRVPVEVIEAVTADEERELQRREHSYRADLPPPDFRNKTVIVVDDGIATGSTMMAAVSALRQRHARYIVVAAPVISATAYGALQDVADEIVAVSVPVEFHGVGTWYEEFAQTTDAEVREILVRYHRADAVSG